MADEIELKLTVPQESVAAFRRHPLLRARSLRRATTRRLSSTYFDTPDLALAKHAMALRVRRIGRHRRVQTLKLPSGGRPNGLQVYREIECPIAGETPDLGLIDDAALQAFFAENDVVGRLAPVFVTEFDRSVRAVRVGGDAEIEVALDRGEIRGGNRALPLCEAELELRSGSPRRVLELALELAADLPLSVEHRTKAERGYGLAAGTAPEPQRARPVPLAPEMTARAAFAEIARSGLTQLRANQTVVLEGHDPEGVHQARVALRRLRTLVSAFRPLLAEPVAARLREELRWLQRQLGPAREWDVFLTETLGPMRRRLPDEPALAELARAAGPLHAAAIAAAQGTLRSPRYAAFLLQVELWLAEGGWERSGAADNLDGPVGAVAAELLERRHGRLRRRGGKHAELDASGLHRLRLLGKKLRYVAEFFQALYPRKATRRYHVALADLQDHLGSLNDAVVARRLLAELAPHLPQPEAGRAAGLVLGWQAARTEGDLAGLRKTWEAFRKSRPFWREG